MGAYMTEQQMRTLISLYKKYLSQTIPSPFFPNWDDIKIPLERYPNIHIFYAMWVYLTSPVPESDSQLKCKDELANYISNNLKYFFQAISCDK